MKYKMKGRLQGFPHGGAQAHMVLKPIQDFYQNASEKAHLQWFVLLAYIQPSEMGTLQVRQPKNLMMSVKTDTGAWWGICSTSQYV